MSYLNSFKKVTSSKLFLPIVIIVAVLLYIYCKQVRGFIKSTTTDSQPSKTDLQPSLATAPASPIYQKSDTWTGPRPGYYFGTTTVHDTRYTGYHRDDGPK